MKERVEFCLPGTGGHTEYIELYENGILTANDTCKGWCIPDNFFDKFTIRSNPFLVLLFSELNVPKLASSHGRL